jgi:hypothetical protein
MDWLKNGERLRKLRRNMTIEKLHKDIGPEVLELLRSMPEPGEGRMWTATRRKEGLSDEFVAALDACSDSDMSPLADYVASDKPLSAEERRVIARKLPKRKAGRPKDTQLRAAASVAWDFYQEWRDQNKRLGISDHGHGDEMKAYAARWNVEDWFGFGSDGEEFSDNTRAGFIARVRELMEKPKHLRGDCNRALITFPLFGWGSKTTKTRV